MARKAMRQGHTLSTTAPRHGHTRLPSRHMSGCDVRTRAHHAHLSMPHLLSAYRDVCVSEAVLRLASHTLYLVAAQCVGLTPDACPLTPIGTCCWSKTWPGEVVSRNPFLSFQGSW